MTQTQRASWRAIEFFAGIGGFACAACDLIPALTITAIDIDPDARAIYQRNWPYDYWTREIESLDVETLSGLAANMWWLSPPCQPYSRRGKQQDIDDPRARALLHLIELIEPLRPQVIGLENVMGFAESQARERLESTLSRLGYQIQSRQLCPTEMGWPNRRPRFYLLASNSSQCELKAWSALPDYTTSLTQLVKDSNWDAAACEVDATDIAKFHSAMDRVDVNDASAVTACFGSSYGKSLLHAGSYASLQHDSIQLRRFAPAEVARLLGYPTDFIWPEHYSYRRLWKLLGNSLSIPAMKYVLSHVTLKHFD